MLHHPPSLAMAPVFEAHWSALLYLRTAKLGRSSLGRAVVLESEFASVAAKGLEM